VKKIDQQILQRECSRGVVKGKGDILLLVSKMKHNSIDEWR
jgi:hypothetical protein